MPIEKDARLLQAVIDELSVSYPNLPEFRAHMTLCSGILTDRLSLTGLVAAIDGFCRGRTQARVSVDWQVGISQRDEGDEAWSTFLFLSLKVGDLFREADVAFRAHGLKARKDPRDPRHELLLSHLSLAYSERAEPGIIDRLAVAERLTTQLRSLDAIEVDAVELITPDSGRWDGILRANAPDNWTVLHRQQFQTPVPSAT